MSIVLKPISASKSKELMEKLDEILKTDQHLIKYELDEFNKTYPKPKKTLIEYFIFANTNELIYVNLSTHDLPDWLTNFLWYHYNEVQNQFA